MGVDKGVSGVIKNPFFKLNRIIVSTASGI
jgi:hypothetical protein